MTNKRERNKLFIRFDFMVRRSSFFSYHLRYVLILLLLPVFIGVSGCTSASKTIGVMYYEIPGRETDSLRIFYREDSEMVERLILARTIDTEQMKTIAKTDNLIVAKTMLLENYNEKTNRIIHWGELAALGTERTLYGNEQKAIY